MALEYIPLFMHLDFVKLTEKKKKTLSVDRTHTMHQSQ